MQLLLIFFSTMGPLPPSEPLRAEAKATTSTAFVGQGIEIRVGVVAEGERPKVGIPRIDGAEIVAVGTEIRQVGASRIGDASSESNVFIYRYRVTPTRPGPIEIPSFHARVGDRFGASNPLRMTSRPIPVDGRPASYLRGVGPIAVKAEIEPSSVRLGQSVEYRLILNGPGARGSIASPPDLLTFGSLPGIVVQPLPTEMTADPPSRVFRLRLRATKPGEVRLPSVEVATFDPTSRRFMETRSTSLLLRVVDVSRFDASTLEIPKGPTKPNHQLRIMMVVGAAGVVGLVTSAVFVGVRVSRDPRASARRASRVFKRSVEHPLPGSIAPQVASALAEYLALATKRAPGEVTPAEARFGLSRAVGDEALADRGERLISECDRIRFGFADDPDFALAREASAFFGDLARRRVLRPPDSS